jgi:hypothetical protein
MVVKIISVKVVAEKMSLCRASLRATAVILSTIRDQGSC